MFVDHELIVELASVTLICFRKMKAVGSHNWRLSSKTNVLFAIMQFLQSWIMQTVGGIFILPQRCRCMGSHIYSVWNVQNKPFLFFSAIASPKARMKAITESKRNKSHYFQSIDKKSLLSYIMSFNYIYHLFKKKNQE